MSSLGICKPLPHGVIEWSKKKTTKERTSPMRVLGVTEAYESTSYKLICQHFIVVQKTTQTKSVQVRDPRVYDVSRSLIHLQKSSLLLLPNMISPIYSKAHFHHYVNTSSTSQISSKYLQYFLFLG